jgi:transcriptional regulator with GAF, ATPase, and Fis domain
MNAFARNPSVRARADTVSNGSSQPSNSVPPDHTIATINRELFDRKVSYLKILALSLLREIASAEKIDESERSDTIDLQDEVRRFEAELIRSALIQTGGRQRRAARLLGTKVTTLNTKIKRYKIKIPG